MFVGYLKITDSIHRQYENRIRLDEDEMRELRKAEENKGSSEEGEDEDRKAGIYWTVIDETDKMAAMVVNGTLRLNQDPINYTNPYNPHGNDLSFLYRNPFREYNESEIRWGLQKEKEKELARAKAAANKAKKKARKAGEGAPPQPPSTQ